MLGSDNECNRNYLNETVNKEIISNVNLLKNRLLELCEVFTIANPYSYCFENDVYICLPYLGNYI